MHHRNNLHGDFDSLRFVPRPGIVTRPAAGADLAGLVGSVSAAIGAPLAETSVIEAVQAHDDQSVWVFERDGRLLGGFAFLFLSEEGVDRMRSGALDMRRPGPADLAAPGAIPAGVYLWALMARGRAAAGLPPLLAMLQGPRFAGADLWAVPFTEDGRRFVINLGFREDHDAILPNLWRYRRRISSRSLQ